MLFRSCFPVTIWSWLFNNLLILQCHGNGYLIFQVNCQVVVFISLLILYWVSDPRSTSERSSETRTLGLVDLTYGQCHGNGYLLFQVNCHVVVI